MPETIHIQVIKPPPTKIECLMNKLQSREERIKNYKEQYDEGDIPYHLYQEWVKKNREVQKHILASLNKLISEDPLCL